MQPAARQLECFCYSIWGAQTAAHNEKLQWAYLLPRQGCPASALTLQTGHTAPCAQLQSASEVVCGRVFRDWMSSTAAEPRHTAGNALGPPVQACLDRGHGWPKPAAPRVLELRCLGMARLLKLAALLCMHPACTSTGASTRQPSVCCMSELGSNPHVAEPAAWACHLEAVAYCC